MSMEMDEKNIQNKQNAFEFEDNELIARKVGKK